MVNYILTSKSTNLAPVDGAHFRQPWYQRHESSVNVMYLVEAGALEAKHSRHTAKIDIFWASRGRPLRL